MFEKTDFYEAASSLGLEGFMFFLMIKQKGELDIDIYQSDGVNLTRFFWMFINIPNTTWSDGSPEFPKSPLMYKRCATYTLVGGSGSYFIDM